MDTLLSDITKVCGTITSFLMRNVRVHQSILLFAKR